MRSTLLILLALGALSGLVGLVVLRGVDGWTEPSVSRITPPPSSWPDHLAANGIVEGARPEVALRPEVSGILEAISIRETQDVTRGTLLAELRNEIQKQEVDLAAAEVKIAQAQLKRLRNGERPEKRRAMAAVEQAKRVVYQQAKADWERTSKLVESQSSSREQGDRDYFAMLRAQAEWDEAAAERALVEAPARADEVAAAEGRVAVAEARLRLVKAELAKTRLLAPSDGRILRVYAEPGEIAGPNTAQPVLLLADLSRRRVRAFIEELDAARVRVGQRAVVTSEGLPGKEFPGVVSLTLPRMGQRGLQTDAAGEYRDIYFREALIDLDAGEELPLNLRVQTRIHVNPGEKPR
ncbi:MAG: HlyD family secretion protein [Planctomycetaceae bacterium]|nr:HlyD family secretion protein [Planctomycetaceae bacterium]